MSDEVNRRILVVDDNPSIHTDFRKVLDPGTGRGAQDLGGVEAALFGEEPAAAVQEEPVYDIASAFQGEEALDLVRRVREEGRPFALAFVDVRMPPGWDGVETIARLWQVDPDLQAVICTAYSDYTWTETIARLGRNDKLLVLKKPFDPIEACQIASALVEKWNVTRRERQRLEEVRAAEQEARAYAASLETVNRALETTLATAEETTRAKSDFLLQISDELLRPISALLGEARELPQQRPQDAELTQLLETIWDEGGLLRRVLDDIVDLSHIEAGQLSVDLGPCEPFTLAREAVHGKQARTAAAGAELVLECATPIPARIQSDGARLSRILGHLIENALERGGAQTVRVVLSMEKTPSWQEPLLRLDVIDRGAQVPQDRVGRLFEPFQEVGDRSMGLSLSRRLAHLLGGDLRVESTPETGTCFSLTVRTGALDGVAMLAAG